MKRIVIISLHAGYWLLYLVLLIIIILCLIVGTKLKYHFSNFRFEIFFSTFAIVPAILAFYTFYGLLFDKFLIRRKILLLFISGILVSIICSIITGCIISILQTFNIGPGIFKENFTAIFAVLTIISLIAILNGGMGLLMKGFIRWYSELKLKEEMMEKNFEMELALVRSQISPHFLFNTLNNIDVLISKNADKASLYLNKLSDIMRFMLYETKTEKIALSKEVAYIEKYIDLHKIRTSNPDFVNFSIVGETDNIEIPPMILIPFIENAFKHAEHIKNGHVIKIEIKVERDNLCFTCENKYQASEIKNEFSGLGHELIVRRLSLLYPEKHLIVINKTSDVYHVKLQIRLHEN